MILAAHMVVGGTAGALLNAPGPAFAAGFILHFILDAVPHYDSVEETRKFTKRQWIFSLTEFALGLVIVFFYMKPEFTLKSSFLWGMLGCLLPDFLDNMPFWQKDFRKSFLGRIIHPIHERVHFYYPSMTMGMAIQIIIILISLAVYKTF